MRLASCIMQPAPTRTPWDLFLVARVSGGTVESLSVRSLVGLAPSSRGRRSRARVCWGTSLTRLLVGLVPSSRGRGTRGPSITTVFGAWDWDSAYIVTLRKRGNVGDEHASKRERLPISNSYSNMAQLEQIKIYLLFRARPKFGVAGCPTAGSPPGSINGYEDEDEDEESTMATFQHFNVRV